MILRKYEVHVRLRCLGPAQAWEGWIHEFLTSDFLLEDSLPLPKALCAIPVGEGAAPAWERGTVKANQLCSRKSWSKTTALLDEAMGWWLLDWGGLIWEGVMPVRLPLCIFQSLRNEKFFKTSLLRWGQQCQKTPATHNMWSYLTRVWHVYFSVCLLAFTQLVIIAIIFDEKPFVAILTLVTIAKTKSSNWL